MNELTKDELKFIREHLIFSTGYNNVINVPMCVTLQNKIQSMIDNYCEHKNQYTDSNYFSGCADCGRKW